MNRSNREISQRELKLILDYDPGSGEFTWIATGNGRRVYGGIAGSAFNQNGKTRFRIAINKMSWMASKLAFIYMTGYAPRSHIYFRDSDATNIAWDNMYVKKGKHTLEGKGE